jgi:hypothetical protein
MATLVSALNTTFIKQRFVAGLADTIGSMAKTHRRFSDDKQIISFEIKGHNFRFVCDLCHLLHDINCIPDQVAWNHPNIHSPSDPYYRSWKKGFKLRILLDQYAKFGALAFKTKAEASKENLKLQHQTNVAKPCPEQRVNVKPKCVHHAENDTFLPDPIRGGHYIHYRHFCAVLGCEHAPYSKVSDQFTRLGELVIPFPVIHRNALPLIENRLADDPLLANRSYDVLTVSVKSLCQQFKGKKKQLLYGQDDNCGYPLATILQAVAFVIADDKELIKNKSNIKGNYMDLIKHHLAVDDKLTVEMRKPDLLTPLVVVGNERGVLVGAVNPNVYKKLVN